MRHSTSEPEFTASKGLSYDYPQPYAALLTNIEFEQTLGVAGGASPGTLDTWSFLYDAEQGYRCPSSAQYYALDTDENPEPTSLPFETTYGYCQCAATQV